MSSIGLVGRVVGGVSGITHGGRIENGAGHVPSDREEIEERAERGLVAEPAVDPAVGAGGQVVGRTGGGLQIRHQNVTQRRQILEHGLAGGALVDMAFDPAGFAGVEPAQQSLA